MDECLVEIKNKQLSMAHVLKAANVGVQLPPKVVRWSDMLGRNACFDTAKQCRSTVTQLLRKLLW
ncbi:hypothetical protein EDF71_12928 [Comamonas sp. JUb58]|nr:hypothetical protein EDF71_12928 [Comamonas sp. JUb58]